MDTQVDTAAAERKAADALLALVAAIAAEQELC